MTLSDDLLHKQARKISDLASMLDHLLKNRSFCKNKQCCRLFSKYIKKVKGHMSEVDKTLYSELLLSDNNKFNNIAENFMEGSVGVKHVIKKFNKKWWSKSDQCFLLYKEDNHYYQFLMDAQGLFSIVDQRLNRETRILYPAIQEMRASKKAA